MFRMKRFIKRVRNLIRWAPIIWRDQDWDYYYVYEIIETKIKHQIEHLKYGEKFSEIDDNEYYIELLFETTSTGDLVEDRNTIEYYYNQHAKAKRVLFKMLEHNIEYWWS
jgi:hypothetical protein